jgi:hypothetical protein
VEVTANVGLPDAFGRPLTAAAKGSFMTSSIAPGPVDGACGPLDGGVTDAAADLAPDAPDDAQSN